MDLWKNERYQEELKNMPVTEDCWEKLYGKHILVTGAAGMVCSFLVDAVMKKNMTAAPGNSSYLPGAQYTRGAAAVCGTYQPEEFYIIGGRYH